MYLLPALSYEADALAPVIGVETMRTHHGKHHARYVKVTNELVGDAVSAPPLEDVIAEALVRGERKLFNNAAQAWNHAFYWQSMTSVAGAPAGSLQQSIESTFGNVDSLRDKFIAAGTAHFGSGWVWLVAAEGSLEVCSSHDADQPWLAVRSTPLLVCDLWEHAYYLDYKNERDRYLAGWFDRLANWDFAAAQFAAAAQRRNGYRYPPPV